MAGLVVAVDFDGTVVEHEYPDVGADVPGAVKVLKKLVAAGVRIVLWTMRSDEELADAVDWYAKREIPLFGVNHNPEQDSWTKSPKAFAQVYVDDAALGAPLRPSAKIGNRPIVNWDAVWLHLKDKLK